MKKGKQEINRKSIREGEEKNEEKEEEYKKQKKPYNN
jgi:hypothetical protein